MYNKKSLLIISFIFIAMACKKEVNITFSEISFTTNNNSIVSVNLPNASGNKDISNLINSEIQRVAIAALHIGDPDNITSASIKESITAFSQEFESFKNDFPEANQLWEAQIDGDVMFESKDIISIAITSYTNTGGAHGNLTISILNFNAKTGERITNTQLFKNEAAFKSVAKTYFNNAVKDKTLLFSDQTFTLPANIGYSEDGLILLYNTYEIAPYSSGIIEFTIPYTQINALLVFNGSH